MNVRASRGKPRKRKRDTHQGRDKEKHPYIERYPAASAARSLSSTIRACKNVYFNQFITRSRFARTRSVHIATNLIPRTGTARFTFPLRRVGGVFRRTDICVLVAIGVTVSSATIISVWNNPLRDQEVTSRARLLPPREIRAYIANIAVYLDTCQVMRGYFHLGELRSDSISLYCRYPRGLTVSTTVSTFATNKCRRRSS